MQEKPENCDACHVHNRLFFDINIAGLSMKVLCDSGSMASYLGPKYVEKFKDRLKPIGLALIDATGNISPVNQVLKAWLDVDGQAEPINLKVSESLQYDMVLGIDFEKAFGLEICASEGEWRRRHWQRTMA